MKKIIEKEVKQNTNIIEKLQKNFPQCFTKDENFNIEKFKELLSNEIDIVTDRYSLNWLGKSYSRLLVNLPVETILAEDVEHNNKDENKNSDNIYIQGDNLEVLKHLSNAYHDKIKVIYIDPPYNTGSDDFIYMDNRKFTKEELSEMANISLEEAENILEFTNSKSNSHSAWLTFMYPRLYIARELLKEDGIIFISIDDNEQAQLKLLCDEIFGENNFVCTFIWQKTYSPKNNNKYVSTDHEYILCYSKSKNLIEKFKRLERNEKSDSFYKYDDNDGKGLYGLADLTIGGQKGYNIHWEGKIFRESPTSGWRFSEKKMYELIKEGRIYLPNDESKRPRYKRYLSEVDGIISKTILPYTIVNHTDGSKKLLNKLIGNNIFDYPKPLELIEYLQHLIIDENDIMLDFFSGSATTAHATMKYNAENGLKNKYIMVQLEEEITEKNNKEAYDFCIENNLEPIIPSIAQERIKRAAAKIKEETKANIDYGFRVFKTVPIHNSSYLKDIKKFDPNDSVIYITNNQSDQELLDLAITWKTYDGIELTKDFKIIDLAGYKGLLAEDSEAGNKLYLMYSNFTTEALTELLRKIHEEPEFIVNKIIINKLNFQSAENKSLQEGIKMTNNKSISIELEERL